MPLLPSWELWILNPSLLSTLWPMVALGSECSLEPKKTPGRLCRATLSGSGSFKTLRFLGAKVKCRVIALSWEEINTIST